MRPRKINGSDSFRLSFFDNRRRIAINHLSFGLGFGWQSERGGVSADGAQHHTNLFAKATKMTIRPVAAIIVHATGSPSSNPASARPKNG